MLGIGEFVLLLLVLLLTGGAVSRLARWALVRRAPGAKQALSVLLNWIDDRNSVDRDSKGAPPQTAKGPKPR